MKLKSNYIFPLLVGLSMCQTNPVLAASHGAPIEIPATKNVASLLHTLGHDKIPADLISVFLTHEESRPITGVCKQTVRECRIPVIRSYQGSWQPRLLEDISTVIIQDADHISIYGNLLTALHSGMKPQRVIFEDFSWYLATILSVHPEATSFYYDGEKKICPVGLYFKKAFHDLIGECEQPTWTRINWRSIRYTYTKKPAA